MWQICNEWTKYHSSLGAVGRYRQVYKQLLYAACRSQKLQTAKPSLRFNMWRDGKARETGGPT
jgi:hypothetical protein